ncbi:MAG: hypothetical protein ACKVVP_20645 [Chloroflexota bacterium]
MAIIKGIAELRSAGGELVGSGMAYLHLPKGKGVAQAVGGTVSCTTWHPDAGAPTSLMIERGPTLTISVSKEAVSQCSQNHILRYTATWVPDQPGDQP